MIAEALEIEGQMTAELKKQLRTCLDAITRWLKAPAAADDIRPSDSSFKQSKSDQWIPVLKPSSTRKPRRLGSEETPVQPASAPRGPQPHPIQEFPEALFEAGADPASFQEALIIRCAGLATPIGSFIEQSFASARPLTKRPC